MPTRLLSIAFACFFSMSAQAQLASDRFSPINSFGRFHGFGFSDGYHACKDGRCKPDSSWKSWAPISSFYGSPSLPPSNRIVPMQSMGELPQIPQQIYVEPSFGNPIEVFSHPELQSQPKPLHITPMQPNAPGMSLPPWSPSQRSMDSVPPPSEQSQPSASDRFLELPAPPKRPESISPAPEVQSRRVPPGTHSLIQQSTFRTW